MFRDGLCALAPTSILQTCFFAELATQVNKVLILIKIEVGSYLIQYE